MKKNFTLFLLIIFAFDIIGYLVIYDIQRWRIKYTIKEQIRHELPNESLTLIVDSGLDKVAIDWREKNEFEFKGDMYDVVRTIIKKNVTYYYCIADRAETLLNKQVDQIVNIKLNDKVKTSKGLTHLIKIIEIVFCHNIYNFTFLLQSEKALSQIPYYNYHSPYIEIYSPPPEINQQVFSHFN
jgi:hypothetical protein